jgi:hypothetical protein
MRDFLQHFVTMLTPFEPAPYQVNGDKHRSHYSHEAKDNPDGILRSHIFQAEPGQSPQDD